MKKRYCLVYVGFFMLVGLVLLMAWLFVLPSNYGGWFSKVKPFVQKKRYPNLLVHLFQEDLQENAFLIGEDFSAKYDGYYKQIKFQTYSIKQGDTLSRIARNFNTNLDTIISYNQIQNARSLRVGKSLLIPNIKGILHTVQKGQDLFSLLEQYKKYEVRLEDILYVNGIVQDRISPGERLLIPGAQLEELKLLKKLGDLNIFMPPVQGRLTSKVGLRVHPIIKKRLLHTGVDIKARYGSPVRSTRRGKVKFSAWKGGYGKLVIIDHGDGLSTYYGHLSKIFVKKGQSIKQGKLIGKVGSTGLSNGPHLHFEVRKHGKPQKVLRGFKGLEGHLGGKWSFD